MISVKTIFEKYDKYSREEIMEAISRLADEDKTILSKAYGENLNDRNLYSLLDQQEKKKVNIIVNGKIKARLKNKSLGPNRRGKIRRPKTIFERYKKYAPEAILDAFYRLTEEEQLLLKKAYGENLDNPEYYLSLNPSEKENVKRILHGTMINRLKNENLSSRAKSAFSYYPEYSKVVLDTFDILPENHQANSAHTTNLDALEVKKKNKGRLKTPSEMFKDYSKEEIESAFNSLKEEEQLLLTRAFGNKLDEIEDYDSLTKKEKNKLSQIKQKMKKNLLNPNRHPRKIVSKKKHKTDSASLTSNSIYDMLGKIEYKPLSRRKEIIFVKKIKLSFYDEASFEEKLVFLEYYKEVFPKFKESYESADEIEKEKLLEKAIDNSLYWRKKFIENNQRLIYSIAKKYQYKAPIDDLMIEGNLGIIKAIRKFDLSKGNKFSTYATHWITQTLTRYIKNYVRTMRLPVHVEDMIVVIRREEEKFETINHRKPTTKELSELTGIKEKRIDKIIEYEFQANTQKSLNETVNEDSDTDFENFIVTEETSYQEIDNQMYYDKFLEIIENSDLSDRTIEILKMRFGFSSEGSKTLTEVGKHFHLSRERVRQIEKSGLDYLRNYSELKRFYDADKSQDERLSTLKESNETKIERLKTLKEIISNSNLSREEIEIMELFYVRELSIKEISELLNLSISETYDIKEKTLKKMNRQGIFI